MARIPGQAFWRKHSDSMALVLISILTLACYANSLGNHFITDYDDQWLILDNPYVHALTWDHLVAFFNPFIDREPLGCEYLPLRDLAVALDYFFWRTNPVGYHLSQVCLHLSSALIFFLTLRLMGLAWGTRLTAALIFALHPLATEPVNWLACRKDTLCVFFVMLAFFFFWGAQRQHGWASLLSHLFFLAALLSKYTAAALPLVLLAIEGLWFHRPHRWRFYLGYGVILALLLPVFLIIGQQAQIQKTYYGGSLLRTLPIMAFVVGEYLRLVVWPLGLQTPYPYTHYYLPPHTLGAPRAWQAWLLLAFASGLLLWQLRRAYERRQPMPGLVGALWFLLFLLPVANLVPIAQLMAERYLYLPLLGFALCTAVLLARIPRRKLRLGGTILILGSFLILSIQRNQDWYDSWHLWQATLRNHPEHPKVWLKLAAYYRRHGAPHQALPFYQRFIQRFPDYADGYIERAECYRQIWRRCWVQGKRQQACQYARRILADYTRAIQCRPRYHWPYLTKAAFWHERGRKYLSCGATQQARGMLAKAYAYYTRALACEQKFAEPYLTRALVGKEMLRLQYNEKWWGQVRRDLAQGLRLHPQAARLHEIMGDLYRLALQARGAKSPTSPPAVGSQDGWRGQAITELARRALAAYARARQYTQNRARIWLKCGNLYRWLADHSPERQQQQWRSCARQAYQKALQQQPRFGQAWINLGILALDQHQNRKALKYFSKALQMQPTPLAYYNRAYLYYQQHCLSAAQEDCSRALALQPQDNLTWRLLLLRAHCRQALGQKAAAQADYQAARRLGLRSPEQIKLRGTAAAD